jgi:hypothetical protein
VLGANEGEEEKLDDWGNCAVYGSSTVSMPRWLGTSGCCSAFSRNSLKTVLSGGALRERVGRCRGRGEVQVLGGGESRAESNLLLLGVWERFGLSSLSASSSSGSISDSRVTIIGRLTGLGLLLPKEKPGFIAGYRGIGETSTVRSVIVDDEGKETRLMICIFIFYLFAHFR